MSTIFNTIPTLNNHPTPNNSHGLPTHLTYWEIILNQHFGNNIRQLEKQWGLGGEDLILALLNSLHAQNGLFITNPQTGEIIWHYNTPTGGEYKVEGF